MGTPFDSYRPFDAGAGADVGESAWRAMAKHWRRDGPLVTGLAPSAWATQLQVYADSSGMRVKVRAGEVWLQGHHGQKSTETILAIGTNSSGSSRIDLVVARADYVANTVELDVVAGTPGGAAPTATNDSTRIEVPLAQVTVANAAVTIASGNVTDIRTLVGDTSGSVAGTLNHSSGSVGITQYYNRTDNLVHEEGAVTPGAVTVNNFVPLAVPKLAAVAGIGTWMVGGVGTTARSGPLFFSNVGGTAPLVNFQELASSAIGVVVASGHKLTWRLDYAALV